MSLATLAVVGRDGAPLYLRDFAEGDNDGDLFGDEIDVAETTQQQTAAWPCNVKYQFVLHAACQRLEESLKENKWRVPGATGAEACWVGFLCLSDNLRAYGYVTTNARYITLVEDSIAPEKEQLQKARDGEVCTLMANVHKLHTESLMNPFTPLGTKITSKRFDAGVAGLANAFNSKG
ncbi:hypothetical protein ACHAXT_012377 [Thalassiosira profunda]